MSNKNRYRIVVLDNPARLSAERGSLFGLDGFQQAAEAVASSSNLRGRGDFRRRRGVHGITAMVKKSAIVQPADSVSP